MKTLIIVLTTTAAALLLASSAYAAKATTLQTHYSRSGLHTACDGVGGEYWDDGVGHYGCSTKKTDIECKSGKCTAVTIARQR